MTVVAQQTAIDEPSAAAIALGSNLGDSAALLAEALERISAIARTQLLSRSPLYRTAPVGPPQPDFLNCCALLRTGLPPSQLLQQLLQVETRMGRVRQTRWGPRHIDIDLLLYGSQILRTATLTLPHPRLHERAFVLVPLRAIAADWVHPQRHVSVRQMAEQVDRAGVDLYSPTHLSCPLAKNLPS
ncbi:MAG: 2-amino-4-hydroxy-6-hydroxymethyldihydropteridine diphosphokinase [Cyanobacteria bacterium P01_A01_bin.105]